MNTLECFEAMLVVVGTDASENQVAELVSWAMYHLGSEELITAKMLAVQYGISDLYTDLDMRLAEKGIF